MLTAVSGLYWFWQQRLQQNVWPVMVYLSLFPARKAGAIEKQIIGKKIGAKMSGFYFFFRSRLVAAMIANVYFDCFVSPTLMNSPDSITRSSFDCSSVGISPISSKNIGFHYGPSSNNPFIFGSPGMNAPALCPKAHFPAGLCKCAAINYKRVFLRLLLPAAWMALRKHFFPGTGFTE